MQSTYEPYLVKLARVLTARTGVSVKFARNVIPHSDSTTIYLPEASDAQLEAMAKAYQKRHKLPAEKKDLWFDILNGLLDHEASHVVNSHNKNTPRSFLVSQCAKSILDACSAPKEMHGVASTVVSNVENALEDIRIEHLWVERFPGAETYLRRLYDSAADYREVFSGENADAEVDFFNLIMRLLLARKGMPWMVDESLPSDSELDPEILKMLDLVDHDKLVSLESSIRVFEYGKPLMLACFKYILELLKSAPEPKDCDGKVSGGTTIVLIEKNEQKSEKNKSKKTKTKTEKSAEEQGGEKERLPCPFHSAFSPARSKEEESDEEEEGDEEESEQSSGGKDDKQKESEEQGEKGKQGEQEEEGLELSPKELKALEKALEKTAVGGCARGKQIFMLFKQDRLVLPPPNDFSDDPLHLWHSSTDKDTIEQHPASDNAAVVNEYTKKVQSLSLGAISRHLVGQFARRYLPNSEGSRINPRKITSLAGPLPELDSLFLRRFEAHSRKNIAVQLIVDCSGSMGSANKIGLTLEAVGVLGLLLDRLHIPFEIIGFTTGRTLPEPHEYGYTRNEALVIPIFKSFSMPFRDALPVLANQEALYQRNNVDGESIATCAARLLTRPEKRKMLFVFEDGWPHSNSANMQCLANHLGAVIRQLEKMGVSVYGIGLGNDNCVSKFFKNSRTLLEFSHLPDVLLQLFLSDIAKSAA